MTRKQLFALIATIIGSAVVFLDGSVVNLALPHIGKDLGGGFGGMQWIMDGYLLSLSALILLGGSLGDIFGQRKVYFNGLIGFGVSSLICGLAPNASVLIGMRVVQGVFGALLVPSALAIINTNFPANMRGVAIGRWTGFSAIVTALGPLIGGYLVDVASWRWIFFINIPLLVVTIVFARLGLIEHVGDRSRKIDVMGATLAMLGFGGVTYGLIEGPIQNWSSGTLAPIVVGACLLGLFAYWEDKAKDPMLKLSLFRSHNFTGANITTFAMYGALGGFFFILGIYLQTIGGYTALQAGASFLPIPIILFFLSSRAGGWSAKYGPRAFMTGGPILAAVGIALLIGLGHHASYLLTVLPGVVVFALGLSLTVAPLTSTVMGSVSKADSGIASGVNNAVSRVAGLVVIALLGLFGAAQAFKFAAILCAVLAATAGIISYLMIQNPQRERPVPNT
jgi:EmrB/QacA subfamily drug resistance transporter